MSRPIARSVTPRFKRETSESIIKRHYLNLHPREEGGQFFRIVPDKERRRAVLAPEKEANPNPHLVAV